MFHVSCKSRPIIRLSFIHFSLAVHTEGTQVYWIYRVWHARVINSIQIPALREAKTRRRHWSILETEVELARNVLAN